MEVLRHLIGAYRVGQAWGVPGWVSGARRVEIHFRMLVRVAISTSSSSSFSASKSTHPYISIAFTNTSFFHFIPTIMNSTFSQPTLFSFPPQHSIFTNTSTHQVGKRKRPDCDEDIAMSDAPPVEPTIEHLQTLRTALNCRTQKRTRNREDESKIQGWQSHKLCNLE